MSSERHGVPILMLLYERYLSDRDTEALKREVSRYYAPATLERLVHAGDRYRRRAAVLALGLIGDYESNQVMGGALVDKDRGVRALAEEGIRLLWLRAGNQYQRGQLQMIIQMVGDRQYDRAAGRATELIEQAPWFAEVWNQRAIAFYQLKRYTDSIRDCRQALEINPYHFGAASGMGQCYLKLNDRLSALECFRRALRLNPNLEGVRAQVIYLQKSLKDK